MKMRKRILSVMLMLAVLVTTCFHAELNQVSAAEENDVGVSVSNIHLRSSSAKLLFFLSAHDYSSAGSTVTIGDQLLSEYNTLDKITVCTETESKTLRELYTDGNKEKYYNIWGETGSVAVDLPDDWNGTAVTKVVIEAGCEFPSYEYTNNSGAAKAAYVVQNKTVFTSKSTDAVDNSANWNRTEIVEKATSVTKIHLRQANDNDRRLLLFLENHDYPDSQASPNVSVGTKLSEYNTLDNIIVYTDGDTGVPLREIYKNAATYNLWTESGCIAFNWDSAYNGTTVTKVVIKAGCEFPSYEYTNNNGTARTTYVVPVDTVFTSTSMADVTNTGSWTRTEVEPVVEEETGVTKIDIANNALRFYLSGNDYGTTAANDNSATEYTEYNYWNNILIYTDETTSKTLRSAYEASEGKKTYYNLWTVWGTFAVSIDQTSIDSAVKIVIPAGTEFPSYEYTTRSTTTQKSYVTTEEIIFAKNDSGTWEKYIPTVPVDTEIDTVHVRIGKLLLFPTVHDYESAASTTQIAVDGKFTDYNTLDNIVVYTENDCKTLSEIVTTEPYYYNIWTETGCVSFSMQEGYDGTTIKKIVIKKGCQLPAYAYTNGGSNTKIAYVVQEDIVFSTNVSDSNNTSWSKVQVRSVETDVTSVQSNNNTTITFQLAESDYAPEKSDAYANMEIGEKHIDYSYWNDIRIYTGEKTYKTLKEAYEGSSGKQKYYNMWQRWNSISIELDADTFAKAERIVIPAGTLFPVYAYTDGTQEELGGYEVKEEMMFEKQTDGSWQSTLSSSRINGDANGDGDVDSRDIIRLKRHMEYGYGVNRKADCDGDGEKDETDVDLLRQFLAGKRKLLTYVKESSSLTGFFSSDESLDFFLNDYFKRHVGYSDYVEGDMTINSYKPGKYYEGIFNFEWNMMGLTWFDSSDTLETDRLANLEYVLSEIPVDRYGYVWDGADTLEEPTTSLANSGAHAMGWPFPNATQSKQNARFWDFNDDSLTDEEKLSTWSSNISAAASGGLYQGTATNASSITYEVVDKYTIVEQEPVIHAEYAPWLAIDLRMYGVTGTIEDVYVSFTTKRGSSASYTTVKASDIAARTYDYTEAATSYEHVLYLPMYTVSGWDNADIYKLKIEIKGDSLSGTFALNYVRPTFDTRHSNNNSIYISSLKQYYNATGDLEFLKENITNARKAMNFYMQMYDGDMDLLKESYIYGHGGSRTELIKGLGNGYWDILYTPEYDFQSNMYFYKALTDMIYLENVLTENGITVNDSSDVATATVGTTGIGTSSYNAAVLSTTKDELLTKMRSYFYNTETGRFMAGYDDSKAKVDYGYVVWNLQAVELGIADETQKQSIMSWISGARTVSGDASSGLDIYEYRFAPRTNTYGETSLDSDKYSSIYGAFIQEGHNTKFAGKTYGNDIQNGGAAMYVSYYDLMSRIDAYGTDNAYSRLKDIQSWYEDVYDYYKNNEDAVANDFYWDYYTESLGITPQNGSKGDGSNGIVGIDGEFTESILTLAAIPYGFFGIDTENGQSLSVTPSLPEELGYWKLENLAFHGVKYDLTIFDGAVRIDSVRGTTDGLTIQVALDYAEGDSVYVNEKEITDYTVKDGKAMITVPFKDTVVEIR